MNTELMREVEELESVVTVCFGKPQGDELPQAPSQEEIILMLPGTIQ